MAKAAWPLLPSLPGDEVITVSHWALGGGGVAHRSQLASDGPVTQTVSSSSFLCVLRTLLCKGGGPSVWRGREDTGDLCGLAKGSFMAPETSISPSLHLPPGPQRKPFPRSPRGQRTQVLHAGRWHVSFPMPHAQVPRAWERGPQAPSLRL